MKWKEKTILKTKWHKLKTKKEIQNKDIIYFYVGVYIVEENEILESIKVDSVP